MTIVTLLSFAAVAAAQDSTRARVDSLAEALRQAQARLDALEQKVGESTENGVHTRSGTRMELTGRVIMQAFGNTRRVNNVDNPQFVRPDTTPDVAVRGGGMSMRQTVLAFRVTSPDVAGAQFNGDVTTDFYGGQFPSTGGRTFPLVRLRTARAILRWTNSELMIGQEVPLISPLNPVSVAASGTPLFAGAGNLWLWLPQLRLTVGGMRPKTVGVQVAVIAPVSGDPVGNFDTDLDAAERAAMPAYEWRIRYRWEMTERLGEAGCGGHLGWLARDASSFAVASGATRWPETSAIACDILAPFRIFELRGEVFSGTSLKGLGGGGIGQSFGVNDRPVHTAGGWAQLNVTPSSIWGFGAGCGIDDPRDRDLEPLPSARQRNASCDAHVIAHPSGPLVLSIEARRLATTYSGRKLSNDHFNIGFGFEF